MGFYYVAGMPYSDELYHHGILGQKWGVRRFQNADGSLTPAGRKRYGGAVTTAEKVKTKVASTGKAVGAKVSSAAKNTGAYVKKRTKMRHPSLMTDEELKEYTNRLIQEKNYSDALQRARSATGFGRAENFVTGVVTAVPKAAAGGIAALPGGVVNTVQKGLNTIADAGFRKIASQITKTPLERENEKLAQKTRRKELLDKLKGDDEMEQLKKQNEMLSLQAKNKEYRDALSKERTSGLGEAYKILSDPNATADEIKKANMIFAAYNSMGRNAGLVPSDIAERFTVARSQATPEPAATSNEYRMRPLESMGDQSTRTGFETRAARPTPDYNPPRTGLYDYITYQAPDPATAAEVEQQRQYQAELRRRQQELAGMMRGW